jgi:hypothetical protein
MLFICLYSNLDFSNSIFLSINSLLWWHSGKFLLVESIQMYLTVLKLNLAGFEIRNGGIGVLHECLVVSIGEIISGMSSTGLFPVDCRMDGLFGLH